LSLVTKRPKTKNAIKKNVRNNRGRGGETESGEKKNPTFFVMSPEPRAQSPDGLFGKKQKGPVVIPVKTACAFRRYWQRALPGRGGWRAGMKRLEWPWPQVRRASSIGAVSSSAGLGHVSCEHNRRAKKRKEGGLWACGQQADGPLLISQPPDIC
jgi:hypothetical protein